MTRRDFGLLLAISAVIGPLYGVIVIVADFGRDAFYLGLCVAIFTGLLIHDALTDDGRPRRFRLFPRRAHHSQRR